MKYQTSRKLNIQVDNIHPDDIYIHERKLANEYIQQYKTNKADRDIICPICEKKVDNKMFEVFSLDYHLCEECWSIVLDTREFTEEHINDYFENSELSKFRNLDIVQNAVTENRESMWANIIEWIDWRLIRYCGKKRLDTVIYNNKYSGFKSKLNQSVVLDNIEYTNLFDFKKPKDIVCIFDSLQSSTDPKKDLESVYENLNDGGIVMITTRLSTGIDILSLKGNNPSILPLDHLLLPSYNGIGKFISSVGFEVLEMSTPGILDLKYIAEAQIPEDQYFLRYIMAQNNDKLNENFQAFLQRNNLSSYVRIIARKG